MPGELKITDPAQVLKSVHGSLSVINTRLEQAESLSEKSRFIKEKTQIVVSKLKEALFTLSSDLSNATVLIEELISANQSLLEMLTPPDGNDWSQNDYEAPKPVRI